MILFSFFYYTFTLITSMASSNSTLTLGPPGEETLRWQQETIAFWDDFKLWSINPEAWVFNPDPKAREHYTEAEYKRCTLLTIEQSEAEYSRAHPVGPSDGDCWCCVGPECDYTFSREQHDQDLHESTFTPVLREFLMVISS